MKAKILLIAFAFIVYNTSFSQLNEESIKVDKWKCSSGNCKNGKGIATGSFVVNKYKCEIKLDGEFENGLIKNGTFTYDCGSYGEQYTYVGTFVNGKREGTGTLTDKQKNVYEGEWKNGKRHGKGKFSHNSGEVSEGIWEDDKMVKLEFLKAASGTIYEGETTGKCKVIYSNGSKYEGYLDSKQRSGMGRMIYSNFDEYEGSWRNDNRNGEGTMFWVNGDVYSGFWKSNNRNGQGTMQWADGRFYTGEWKTNKMHGFGKYTADGKDTIAGYFYNDKFYTSNKADWEAKLKDDKASSERAEKERQELASRLYPVEKVVKTKSHCVTYLLSEKSVNIFGGASVRYYAIFINVPYEGNSPTQVETMKYAEEARIAIPAGMQVVQQFVNEDCECYKVKDKLKAKIDISEFRIDYSKTIK